METSLPNVKLQETMWTFPAIDFRHSTQYNTFAYNRLQTFYEQ